MVAVAHPDEGGARVGSAVDRLVGGPERRDLARPVVGVDDGGPGAGLRHGEVGVAGDAAGLQSVGVRFEPDDAVGVDAMEVGVNERVRDGVRRARREAGPAKHVGGELFERVGVDDDAVGGFVCHG